MPRSRPYLQDIWKGYINRQPVCLKVPRIFNEDYDKEKIIQVRDRYYLASHPQHVLVFLSRGCGLATTSPSQYSPVLWRQQGFIRPGNLPYLTLDEPRPHYELFEGESCPQSY
jgi:hypothetical protein